MALSPEIAGHLEEQLTAVVSAPVQIINTSTVSGGSINKAYYLQTKVGKFMLKQNSKDAYPGMFAAESIGLQAIAATNTIAVPQVVLQSDFENQSFLVLEWIESRRVTPKAAAALGRQLAHLHRYTAPYFGFDTDNYMGSLPQSNKKHDNWTGFFIHQRLQPMVKVGVDKKLLHASDIQKFEKLYLKLNELFDEEASSLIHGDLWRGNYLISTTETPYLIDPAISYGNREFDIAMTTLFGGFPKDFYTAYHETFPLNKGWQQRLDLWNLYPLLVHLNLFGLSYLGQVRDAVEEYV